MPVSTRSASREESVLLLTSFASANLLSYPGKILNKPNLAAPLTCFSSTAPPMPLIHGVAYISHVSHRCRRTDDQRP